METAPFFTTPWRATPINGSQVRPGELFIQNFTVKKTSWTDSPVGNYAASSDNALTTVSLDLSGVSSATLSFWHRFMTERYRDYCRVEVSTDGWKNFKELRSFSGTQDQWVLTEINMDNYLDADVQIRFRMTSNDNTTTDDGWYIDDVKLCSPDRDWSISQAGTTSHTYARPGNFAATLRVTDKDGNQETASTDILVIPDSYPDALVDADVMIGVAPLTVEFTATGSDDDEIASYDWNFGEEFVWVGDCSNDEVVRLCQDGSCEMARVEGFNDPYSVAINPDNGTVWVVDYYNHDVVKLSADGQTELVRAEGFLLSQGCICGYNRWKRLGCRYQSQPGGKA